MSTIEVPAEATCHRLCLPCNWKKVARPVVKLQMCHSSCPLDLKTHTSLPNEANCVLACRLNVHRLTRGEPRHRCHGTGQVGFPAHAARMMRVSSLTTVLSLSCPEVTVPELYGTDPTEECNIERW